ncbi:MAG: cysteine--tRNA ligase [bacterium]|nr:cysteine--tRNA ligase [bacterium]
MLALHNSLTKTIEPFRPLRGRSVRVYTCGPTVYDFAHVGNLRSYVFADVLRRTLLLNGLRVKHVMNITDVGHLVGDADTGEDKLERAAAQRKQSARELADFYTQAFLQDLERLHILTPDAMPKATEYIAQQIALVERLEKQGYTYTTSDGVYFDTAKLASYGTAFRGQKLEEKAGGMRVAVGEKRLPHDFALWKLSNPTPPSPPFQREGGEQRKRQQEWESPWGTGFPGWHLECSVMSRELLGQPFDIHTGGIDHIPVHHTNEIAQSEAAYGKPLAAYWLHGAFLTVDGKRMGKSEGNLITITQLIERGIDPLAYRYLVLGAHYRSPLNFTWESLTAAQHALEHLRTQCREFPKPPVRVSAQLKVKVHKTTERFLDAMNDDLDTPKALALLWECLKKSERTVEQSAFVAYADEVFALGLRDVLGKPFVVPPEVLELVRAREHARTEKDWARADRLRAQIAALGYTVEDTQDGPKVRGGA